MQSQDATNMKKFLRKVQKTNVKLFYSSMTEDEFAEQFEKWRLMFCWKDWQSFFFQDSKYVFKLSNCKVLDDTIMKFRSPLLQDFSQEHKKENHSIFTIPTEWIQSNLVQVHTYKEENHVLYYLTEDSLRQLLYLLFQQNKIMKQDLFLLLQLLSVILPTSIMVLDKNDNNLDKFFQHQKGFFQS